MAVSRLGQVLLVLSCFPIGNLILTTGNLLDAIEVLYEVDEDNLIETSVANPLVVYDVKPARAGQYPAHEPCLKSCCQKTPSLVGLCYKVTPLLSGLLSFAAITGFSVPFSMSVCTTTSTVVNTVTATIPSFVITIETTTTTQTETSTVLTTETVTVTAVVTSLFDTVVTAPTGTTQTITVTSTSVILQTVAYITIAANKCDITTVVRRLFQPYVDEIEDSGESTDDGLSETFESPSIFLRNGLLLNRTQGQEFLDYLHTRNIPYIFNSYEEDSLLEPSFTFMY